MSWLDELKIGDKVIVGNYKENDIATVSRITKTLVLIKYPKFSIEEKYSRKDGKKVPYNSYSFHTRSLKQWTIEEEKQILLNKKYKNNRYRFRDLKVTDAEIEIMLNALDEFRAKNTG